MRTSPDQQTITRRQRRVRRAAGLLAGGAVVATSALALTALVSAEDTSTADPDPIEERAPVTVAFVAPTTTAPPAPSPAEVFAATWEGWTDEERLRFRIYVGTPEEREAIFTWLFPPPPPPPASPAPPVPPRPPAKSAKPAPRANPAPRPQAAPSASASASASHAAPGGYLACVRQRESGGRYGTNTGNGYYGAYQFLPSTWNSTARAAGRPDLVGVLPSSASPADQDAMARQLHSSNGRQPWAGTGC